MTTNTKVTLMIAAFALVFLATTAIATTAYWSQRDKRRLAEGQVKTAKLIHRTDSLLLVKAYEDLRKCEAQPRITVQSGKRNKVTTK